MNLRLFATLSMLAFLVLALPATPNRAGDTHGARLVSRASTLAAIAPGQHAAVAGGGTAPLLAAEPPRPLPIR